MAPDAVSAATEEHSPLPGSRKRSRFSYFFVRLPAFSYCIGVRSLHNKGVNPLEDAQIIDLFLARSETAISQTAIRYGRYLKTIAGKGLPLPVQRQSPRAARYAA